VFAWHCCSSVVDIGMRWFSHTLPVVRLFSVFVVSVPACRTGFVKWQDTDASVPNRIIRAIDAVVAVAPAKFHVKPKKQGALASGLVVCPRRCLQHTRARTHTHTRTRARAPQNMLWLWPHVLCCCLLCFVSFGPVRRRKAAAVAPRWCGCGCGCRCGHLYQVVHHRGCGTVSRDRYTVVVARR